MSEGLEEPNSVSDHELNNLIGVLWNALQYDARTRNAQLRADFENCSAPRFKELIFPAQIPQVTNPTENAPSQSSYLESPDVESAATKGGEVVGNFGGDALNVLLAQAIASEESREVERELEEDLGEADLDALFNGGSELAIPQERYAGEMLQARRIENEDRLHKEQEARSSHLENQAVVMLSWCVFALIAAGVWLGIQTIVAVPRPKLVLWILLLLPGSVACLSAIAALARVWGAIFAPFVTRRLLERQEIFAKRATARLILAAALGVAGASQWIGLSFAAPWLDWISYPHVAVGFVGVVAICLACFFVRVSFLSEYRFGRALSVIFGAVALILTIVTSCATAFGPPPGYGSVMRYPELRSIGLGYGFSPVDIVRSVRAYDYPDAVQVPKPIQAPKSATAKAEDMLGGMFAPHSGAKQGV